MNTSPSINTGSLVGTRSQWWKGSVEESSSKHWVKVMGGVVIRMNSINRHVQNDLNEN